MPDCLDDFEQDFVRAKLRASETSLRDFEDALRSTIRHCCAAISGKQSGTTFAPRLEGACTQSSKTSKESSCTTRPTTFVSKGSEIIAADSVRITRPCPVESFVR